jgi:hypothetical protein
MPSAPRSPLELTASVANGVGRSCPSLMTRTRPGLLVHEDAPVRRELHRDRSVQRIGPADHRIGEARGDDRQKVRVSSRSNVARRSIVRVEDLRSDFRSMNSPLAARRGTPTVWRIIRAGGLTVLRSFSPKTRGGLRSPAMTSNAWRQDLEHYAT